MVTELQIVIVESLREISTVGDVFEVDGVPYSGTAGSSLIDWIAQILAVTTGTIGHLSHEFIEFDLDQTLKILNGNVADMLGLVVNQVYPASLFYSPFWGNSRLILQNVANLTGTNSILKSFDEISTDFNNETTILRGFAPISNYEEDNDREAYKAEIRFFPASRKGFVKEFLEVNGKGVAQNLYIHNLTHKVPDDEVYNLNLKDYSGITDQYSYKDLKQFDIGFVKGI